MTILEDPEAAQHAEELRAALRGYRSHKYRQYRQYRARRAYVEDIEWLLEAGESTHQVAARLGVTRNAVARRLGRYGRHDLAARFERINDWNEVAA